MTRRKKASVSLVGESLLRFWWLWTGLAVVAVYALCMILAIGQSVWFDEGYSILLAKQSVSDIMTLTAVDAHPPLYYLALKTWASVFGWSEFALRSLSAVAAAGSVGVMMVLIRALFSTRLALAASPFLVFAPFVLRYGYEVRMYALTALIAVVATLVLVWAVKYKKWYMWAVYAVLVAIGMYTLYLIAAVWVAHVVWLVVRSVKAGQKVITWRWPLVYVGAAALYIPYLSTFFHQLNNSALPGIGGEVTLTSLVNVYATLSLYTPEWALGGWLSLLLLGLAAVMIWQFLVVYKGTNQKYKDSILLLLILAFVPILFFMASSLPPRDPIFVIRYMAHVSLFWYVLVAVIAVLGLKYGKKAIAAAIIVVLLGTAGFGVLQLQKTGNFNFERSQNPQTTQLRSETVCNEDTAIVADDPYTYIDTIYYFDGCDVRFFAKDVVEKKGGYAPLHDSDARISNSQELSSERLIHLTWHESPPSFIPDERYMVERIVRYDKQVATTYRLIEE